MRVGPDRLTHGVTDRRPCTIASRVARVSIVRYDVGGNSTTVPTCAP
jgi:hypothetical protein